MGCQLSYTYVPVAGKLSKVMGMFRVEAHDSGAVMMPLNDGTPRLTPADYVDIRDEIMIAVSHNATGILLADNRYYFTVDYGFGDGDRCLRLKGYVDIYAVDEAGDFWTPGGFRRYAKIHLNTWECKAIEYPCTYSDFPVWESAECDFDPRKVDGYEYDM